MSVKKIKEVFLISVPYQEEHKTKEVQVELTINIENKTFNINKTGGFDKSTFCFIESSARGEAVVKAFELAVDKYKNVLEGIRNKEYKKEIEVSSNQQ